MSVIDNSWKRFKSRGYSFFSLTSDNKSMMNLKNKSLSAYKENISYFTYENFEEVMPNTIYELQDIVDEARLTKRPLYPISTGFNWGLGSNIPVKANCLVVNLKKLNHIYDYDEEKGIWYHNYNDYMVDGKPNTWTRKHLEDLRPGVKTQGRPKSFMIQKIAKFKKANNLGDNVHTDLEPGEK